MASDESDAAESMRQRLRTDLRRALRARASIEISALRALIAAIDNAGAVDLPPLPRHSEVMRRRLSAGDVRAVLEKELEANRRAAEELSQLGLHEASSRSALEVEVVSRYLAT